MNDFEFNIAAIRLCTEAEGPGKRLAIWFQGCYNGCRGCCNPDFTPIVSKNIVHISKLIDIIERSKEENKIEGVTYTGGEPTLQAGLPALSSMLKNLNLGIIMFTGKIIDDIDPYYLSYVDLVVDGAYIEHLQDNERNLVGSTNQNIISLTHHYDDKLEWFIKKRPKRVEIEIDSDLVTYSGDVV